MQPGTPVYIDDIIQNLAEVIGHIRDLKADMAIREVSLAVTNAETGLLWLRQARMISFPPD